MYTYIKKIHNYGIKSALYVLVLKNILNFNIASLVGSSIISSSVDQPTVSAAKIKPKNILVRMYHNNLIKKDKSEKM